MIILQETNLLSHVGSELLIAFISAITALVGGYIIIRERILKTELKLNAMTDYIDRKNELLENKIRELQEDITEFKELNKETTRSLAENTAAIRELKLVLNLLKEQLGVKGARRLKNSSGDEF